MHWLVGSGQANFCVTGPYKMERSSDYILNVLIYPDGRLPEVMEKDRENQFNNPVHICEKRGVHIAPGTDVTVKLKIDTLRVKDPEDKFYWNENITNASFPVSVPEDAKYGNHQGTVFFYVNGIQIVKLHYR